MVDVSPARAFAILWQPERAGRRSIKNLGDAIVEPAWGGIRVVACLVPGAASLWRDGTEVRVPAELPAALVEAFRALDAVVEGHLTTMALQSGVGAVAALPRVERPPILIPRAIRDGVKDDPYVQARDHEAHAVAIEPAVREALERGERHAFVATDLLWLDGQSLVDVPLLERKRHLETVLLPSHLVRVTPFVRPTAALLFATWGDTGLPRAHLPGDERPLHRRSREPRPSGGALAGGPHGSGEGARPAEVASLLSPGLPVLDGGTVTTCPRRR